MNFDLIIANISKNIKLTEAEIEYFVSLLEPKVVKKKDFLIRTGDICRYDYFVNTGCLKVCYSDEKGAECIIKFAIENWWVVDLDSFLNARPSFYYIQAVEDTTLYQLSRANYKLLHQQIPEFEKFSNMRWQNGFIALQQRIIQNLSLTAEERYDHFKMKYPDLELRISQKLIAAYLGISPEFLSTLRRKRTASIS
ncbi:MAG TPA: Crp/Fnr family transcriptional regulator [Chitinophagaceae bacterium]|nr:Crp/Fnr family transcriptional regulator [Chitinophagaceae bacterium]